MSSASAAGSGSGEQDEPSVDTDFAWKVHGQLDTWTGRVDSKASFALAIETATLGYVVTLSGPGRRFDALQGSSEICFYAGVGLVLLSMLAATFVVTPRLRRWHVKKEAASNFIYFGHLKFWDPAELAQRLPAGDPDASQLARQLVNMAKIAWFKHAILQVSLILLVASLASFGLAVVIS